MVGNIDHCAHSCNFMNIQIKVIQRKCRQMEVPKDVSFDTGIYSPVICVESDNKHERHHEAFYQQASDVAGVVSVVTAWSLLEILLCSVSPCSICTSTCEKVALLSSFP